MLNIGLLYNYVVYSQNFFEQSDITAAAQAALSIVAGLDSISAALQLTDYVQDKSSDAYIALGTFSNDGQYVGGADVASVQQASATILAYIAKIVSLTAIIEYPITINSPYTIVAGQQGDFWFSVFNGDSIGKIDTAGNVTATKRINLNVGKLVVAPDGSLWFTAVDNAKIYSIDAVMNNVSSLATTYGNSGDACGICVGSDGNIWFAEGGGVSFIGDNFTDYYGQLAARGALARVNPTTKELVEFDSLGAVVWGVAAGPDGNIWFTDIANSRVGRIAVDGTGLVYFAMPTAESAPTSIVPGSDGNMWVLETGNNSIARVTPAGVITEYAVPVATNGLYSALAVGIDGSVWCTDGISSAICLLNPTTGTSVLFMPTGNSGLWGIAVGLDGAIWFTEMLINKIGKLSLL